MLGMWCHCGVAHPLLARPVRTTQLRRGKRQGKWTDRARVPVGPGDGVPVGRALHFSRVYQTTLGNGYLGSRIDEERSEMRYLV